MAAAQSVSTTLPFRGSALPALTLGAGERIGYLHGPLGNPVTWPFLDRLAARAQVVAPTMPGFAGEPADQGLRTIYDWTSALSEIIDAADLTGRPVIASSMIAMLALELAAIRPEAFSQLFLIAPLGLWDESDPVLDIYARLSGQERPFFAASPESLAPFFDDAGVSEPGELVERSVRRYVARTTAASLVWPIPEYGLADRLHRVRCPVTLIWGETDQVISPAYAERFAALIPGARIERIAGAGHLAEHDRPDEVAARILDLLKLGARH